MAEGKTKDVKKAVEEDDDDISDIDVDEDDTIDDDERDPGLADLEVVTKYKLASDMANRKRH